MNTKTLLQSKTIWLSLATICGGLGLFFSGEKSLEELMIVIVGAIFAYLRTITDTPISGIK